MPASCSQPLCFAVTRIFLTASRAQGGTETHPPNLRSRFPSLSCRLRQALALLMAFAIASFLSCDGNIILQNDKKCHIYFLMQKANAFCMEKMRLGCAHNLCAKGAQISHLRGDQYISGRQSRRIIWILILFHPAGRNSTRSFLRVGAPFPCSGADRRELRCCV